MSAPNSDSRFPYIAPKIIVNELKQLQRKLGEILSLYERPLASILPEARQVEDYLLFDDIEIEGLYDRFSSWDGSISKKAIRDWLNHFETTQEQNIAYLLLSQLQFFSKRDIESATRSLQQKLLGASQLCNTEFMRIMLQILR